MGIEVTYNTGRTTKTKSFTDATKVVCDESGPLVKVLNPHLEQSTVFAVHEDRIMAVEQV